MTTILILVLICLIGSALLGFRGVDADHFREPPVDKARELGWIM
jgi:hypothetical protein